MGATRQSGVWGDIYWVSCIRQLAACPPGTHLSLPRRMLRGRCQQRRVSIRACLQCYAHGCPCSLALLWVGRWHSTRGILRCLSSPRRFPYLIAQSQGSLALASGSRTTTLQSSGHKLMNQTRSYGTSSRPWRKEGLAGRRWSLQGWGVARTHPRADFCLLAFCLATVWASKDALRSKLFSMAKASVKRLGLQ